MSDTKKVTIIGCGFVGTAAYQAFSQVKGWDVRAYDKFPDTCRLNQESKDVNFVGLGETIESDLCLIALPTPMNKATGKCDTGLVEDMVRSLRTRRLGIEIVIKSTVPPGTTKRLDAEYGGVYFNPEFLTEADPYNDFVNLPYQIVGNPGETRAWNLMQLYRDAATQYLWDTMPVINGGKMILECDSDMAEMVKLTRNCYLATRLSFFNEIKQMCDKLNVSYDDMRPLVGLDDRIGNHYNKVSSENPGWGLSCLPKDLNDMMFTARELGVDPKVMQAVWDKNLEVRTDRDWERMEKAVKS
jgi:UDPglucose 6-dehydrogenase